jgi:transmembrane sensor
VLSDGSVVQLNTLTQIIVRFDAQHRHIEVPRGEAFFRVARDSTRPFDVETPFAVVRAVGTEFNVYNRAGSTRVAVVEGRVRVTPRAPGSDEKTSLTLPKPLHFRAPRNDLGAVQPLTIGPQQTVDVTDKGAVEAMPAPRATPTLDSATAWMQRRIVFNNQRLDDAVAEFNRYNRLQMKVSDPDLASLRITAVFDADDPQALVAYLERLQRVEARRESDAVVLVRRR